MARKLSTIIFINILKKNLVFLRPKYGILPLVIAGSLIQPCNTTAIPGELAFIWFPQISAAIFDISLFSSFENKSVDQKAVTYVFTLNYKKLLHLK